MKRQHYIYRGLLYLYPQSFRQRYGDEMVQVLDDLLNEQADGIGALMVWIRVGSELPFSIAQENIDNLGGKAMNTVVLKKNRRVIAITVAALILSAGALSLTLLRDRLAVPFVIAIHGNTNKTEFASMNNELGDPVKALSTIETNPAHACSLVKIDSIGVHYVDCYSATTRFVRLENIGDKSAVLQRVATIEQKLKEQGYAPGSNDITLTSQMTSIYNGIDSSPNATYVKVSGKYRCNFDTSIAYSKPNVPAINTMFTCHRSFDI